MATRHIWKASLLTAIFILSATGAQAEASNPEDGSNTEPSTQSNETPCTLIIIGDTPPFARVQWECLDELLSWP